MRLDIMDVLKQMSVTVVKVFFYLLEIQNRTSSWRVKDLCSIYSGHKSNGSWQHHPKQIEEMNGYSLWMLSNSLQSFTVNSMQLQSKTYKKKRKRSLLSHISAYFLSSMYRYLIMCIQIDGSIKILCLFQDIMQRSFSGTWLSFLLLQVLLLSVSTFETS